MANLFQTILGGKKLQPRAPMKPASAILTRPVQRNVHKPPKPTTRPLPPRRRPGAL